MKLPRGKAEVQVEFAFFCHWISLLCSCTENPGENAGEFSIGCHVLVEVASSLEGLPAKFCSWGIFPAGVFQVCSTTQSMLGFAGKASQREERLPQQLLKDSTKFTPLLPSSQLHAVG